MHLFSEICLSHVYRQPRYRISVRGLSMIGASTWLGGGTNTGPGGLASREMLRAHRLRRMGGVAGAAFVAG
ncbi:hypothetical protein [Thermosporothrix hazakensis]|uniref:hypothetical protein n=1 Tax=Thermosporothrix hazakensis TaxID=644383 RepID=UPI001B86DF5D|nr:hypothetical protein [Thermosporothrix hazakensis]